jgi:nucleotide-binding universal stress UspA family protein
MKKEDPMFPVKKILCPTDFSEPSFAALKAAAEMAEQFFSELFVVHVVPPVPMVHVATGASSTQFNVVAYQSELAQSSKAILEEVAVQKIPKNVAPRPVVLNGDPSTQILRFAEENAVDLIVIATHGQRGWRRLVFGSVTEKVVREASCPVLAIHEPREKG